MTIDALSRVPPSGPFATTLSRAADYARHQSHRRVTLEHLLLALCDDADAGRVLAASRVDVRQIMIDASGYVGRIDDRAPPNHPVEPTLDPELSRILEYATVAAQQSGRREINGAIVLAAIVGDEQSAAATILRNQGLTFDEAITVLRQTARQPGDAPPPPQQPPQPAAPQATMNGPSTEQILANVRERIETGRPQTAPPAQNQMPSWASQPLPRTREPAAPYQPMAEPQAWAQNDRHMPPPPSNAPQWQEPPRPPSYPPDPYSQPAQAPYPPHAGYGGVSMPAYAEQAPQPQPYAPQAPPQSQPQSQPRPAPPRRSKSPETVAVLPLTAVDPDRLAEMLPDRLTREATETVELRVARGDLANLGVSLGSGPGASRPDLVVSRSLTVRLRSADNRLTVEPVTPETQWIDRSEAYVTAEDLSWRWTVTGRRRGKAALLLSVGARTVALDGMPVESALPEQKHDVHVSINWVRLTGRILLFATLLLLGAVLAMSSSLILDLVLSVMRRG